MSTSRTGLLASPTKKIKKNLKIAKKKSLNLGFSAISSTAPIILRRFAGLYNPYPYGCSLLCNHPTDKEAKDVLKRARETWATENKNVILPAEIQAIRDNFAYSDENNKPIPIEPIPEELFRRYTETDSRPLTPAPTLASVKTRGSSSRRCVTPDPFINSDLQERTLLILDLRRSHSQEIISWHGTNDPPVINILQVPTPTASIDSTAEISDSKSLKETAKSEKITTKKSQKLEVPNVQHQKPNIELLTEGIVIESSDGEEEIIKRKGKRRKKRGRDSSRGPLAVQASIDPETQVSAFENTKQGNKNTSPLVKIGSIQNDANSTNTQNIFGRNRSVTKKSILDQKTLTHLQRELTSEICDMEFNKIKKAVLEEALRTVPLEVKLPCEEMLLLKEQLNFTPINILAWLNLPRIFTRRSCRFELPLISEILNTITPLEYLENHTMISKHRKLLYNIVFNRHKIVEEQSRILDNSENEIQKALSEMMGRPVTTKQMQKFRNIVNWKDEDIINFKTWCGMCALFERIFASEFVANLPNKETDPCDEVEVADFQSLARRLIDAKPDENLVKMLNLIKEL